MHSIFLTGTTKWVGNCCKWLVNEACHGSKPWHALNLYSELSDFVSIRLLAYPPASSVYQAPAG
jgi:hypothetical protein